MKINKYKIKNYVFPNHFIAFLKKYKILESYISYVEASSSFNDRISEEGLISGAFIWLDTKEGINFWGDINKKWYKLLKNED